MNATAKPSPRRRAGMLATLAAAVALIASAVGAAPASAAFGFNGFDVTFTDAESNPAVQAGSHPDAVTTTFNVNYSGEGDEALPDGELKNLDVEQIAGLVGDATVIPRCSNKVFYSAGEGGCPKESQVGEIVLGLILPETRETSEVYNLTPPPGVAVRIGFRAGGALVPVVVDLGVKQSADYNVVASLRDAKQTLKVFVSELTLWGVPADHGTGAADVPFITLPGDCSGPLRTAYRATSWQGDASSGGLLSHDDAEPPNPQGFTGCGKLPFSPQTEAQPTSHNAGAGSGLDFAVEFDQQGLTSSSGLAQSTIKEAEITLPEGITVDPSLAEGIGVCSPGELADEKIGTAPGGGCPQGSKIGRVDVDTPLLDETIEGHVYLAKPYDNLADNSLIAFYIVLKEPTNGILVKLPAKVTPDPSTGRLVTTLRELPQLPFSSFNFHFREGQRAPLITPSACGAYTTEAELTPWARPAEPVTQLSTFEITAGVNGGACPVGGVPPFDPGFSGGALNNAAGAYSQFDMRLLRGDGEQDLTKFSATLPPGVLGRLSGLAKCSDAAIATAKAKTGLEELASPSCPAGSEIGKTIAGAGVGTALTYVPGRLYLGGPYHGDPLSVIAITPAVAGPFDVGNVVVQEALTLNPATAEVEVDGSASDPIPHILKGIPLKLRELRVEVDRPDFTLNSTSCAPSSVKATLWGSFLDLLSPADDRPVDRSDRYQAADCQALGFMPKLGLRLKGGTKRGAFPGLKAHYKPTPGHANIKDLVVRLPRSAFLEQGHIRTICTRVQFAADNCPKGARYGYIRAWTPLLDEPLQGPVWLRSSNHKLPDLVFDLRGIVDVEVQTRIDSVRGGIRARVENAPDAPISRVILNMQGGKKGLIVNSRNLCTKRKARANAKGTGQNGKQFTRRPVLRPQCGKRRKAKRSSHSRVSRVARASKAG